MLSTAVAPNGHTHSWHCVACGGAGGQLLRLLLLNLYLLYLNFCCTEPELNLTGTGSILGTSANIILSIFLKILLKS